MCGEGRPCVPMHPERSGRLQVLPLRSGRDGFWLVGVDGQGGQAWRQGGLCWGGVEGQARGQV